MEDTRVTLSPAQRRRLAKGHAGDKETGNWNFDCLAGCGALRSSAKDMVRFLAANLGRFKTKLYPALKRAQSGRTETATPGLRAAMGWHVWTKSDTEVIWHNGGTGGYRSFCGFIKDKKIGAVVLSNMNISADDIGFHLLDNSYELKKPERP